MASISDFLFGANPTPQVSSSTSNSSAPLWYQQYLQGLIQKGSNAANVPYQANPNPRVAPLTDNQNQAYSEVAAMQGAEQPTLDTAKQYATQAGTAVSPDQINNYLNPYTSNVVDTIGSLAGRNLSENLLPAVNDTFTGAGQFGSSRHGDFTERAIRDANESALNAQSGALQSGFNTALSAAQGDQSRQLQAGSTLGSLATTGQQVGLQGAAALEAAGQSQQQQGQKNLDVLNSDFTAQQNNDKNNVSWLSGILNGSNVGQNTTTNSTTQPSSQQPSGLSGIVGALGGIGSLIGSFFKEGGEVKSRHKPKATQEQGDILENDAPQELENTTGPGGASASARRAAGVSGHMPSVLPNTGPGVFNPEQYFRKHGYRLGENPSPPQQLDPPTLPTDADGNVILKRSGGAVRRYQDGGSVASLPGAQPNPDLNVAWAAADQANFGGGQQQQDARIRAELTATLYKAGYSLDQVDAMVDQALGVKRTPQARARGGAVHSLGSLARAA